MGQIQTANEIIDMYALVMPMGHLIMGSTIPNDENWLSPIPNLGGGGVLAGPQLILNQRSLPMIEPYSSRSACQSAHLGLWRTIKRLQNCYQRFADVFSRHDRGLVETSVVEHEIK